MECIHLKMKRIDPDWAAVSQWREWPGLMSGLVVGTGFHSKEAQAAWSCAVRNYVPVPCSEGDVLAFTALLRREPGNPHDENAIAVYLYQGESPNFWHIGYVPKAVAAGWAQEMDEAQIDEIKVPSLLHKHPRMIKFKIHLWPLRIVSYLQGESGKPLQLTTPVQHLSESWPAGSEVERLATCSW